MFIVLEGTHGAGKSTVAKILSENYGFRLFKTPPNEYEPIRNYMHEQADGVSRFLYYIAGVIDISSQIKKTMETGVNIVCDRYYQSTIASCVVDYSLDFDFLNGIIKTLDNHIVIPDKVFFLKAHNENRVDRLKERYKTEPSFKTNTDNHRIMELEDIHLNKLYSPDYWEIIDTDNMSPSEIAESIFHKCN